MEADAISADRPHANDVVDHLRRARYWRGQTHGLTPRECDVLELLLERLSNDAIAERLYVGTETVKSHVSAIYRKLDIVSRRDAIERADRGQLFAS
jgi:ATP/maltotriose-dependent transcriptional regulator MalT